MVKLLVAAVLVAVMGVMISRLSASPNTPSDPIGAQHQADKARQDISGAVNLENQHAANLDTP